MIFGVSLYKRAAVSVTASSPSTDSTTWRPRTGIRRHDREFKSSKQHALPDTDDTRIRSRTVYKTDVIRGGALIAGSFATFCLVVTLVGVVPLMHPFLALLIIVASIGFFAISLVDK
jgi:hypothetical protein